MQKSNRSGSTGVVIVDKSSDRIHYLKTIGVSSDEQKIAALLEQSKKWIDLHCSHQDPVIEADCQCQCEAKQVTEHSLTPKHKAVEPPVRQKFSENVLR